MAKLKVSALMATAAAVLVFLGVGWSNEEPPPAPLPQPLPAPTAAAARAEPPKQSAPVSEKPSADVPADVDGVPFRGPNFVVYAPTAMMARVIASEAEYHRRIFARKWLGRELPRWDKPCVIHFERHPQSGGTTTFTFGKEKAGQPALTSAEMTLHGEFMHVLANELPHEVMHAVLATDFGKPIPRWADEGIAVLAESEEEQFRHETRLRELLNAGRGIRLRVLLRMTDYPRDMLVLYAQGRSLARFLVNRPLPEGAQLLKNLPHVGRLFEGPWSDGRRRFLAFVYLGMQENTPESWGKAAKDVYGFESIDALEEAWMDSLRKPPGNVTKPKSKPAPSQPEPTTGRDFIPPAKLPTAPKAGPPPEPRP